MKELAALLLPADKRLQFLEEVKGVLSPEQFEKVRAVFEGSAELLGIVEARTLSMSRLCARVFGPKTEKGHRVCTGPPLERPQDSQRRPGHGRTSHRRYTGARRLPVPHPQHQPGDPCPDCGRGKLRRQKAPATTVTLTAQPPVAALIHERERLRCDTCGRVFTAPLPAQAAPEKFDPSVGVMVGLLRYGSGMPFHRLERLQRSVGVPLPASVQWEQAHRVARCLEPVVEHLVQLAAQSAVFYNDDTAMRIAGLRQQIQTEDRPKRTGIFTTGIVCEGLQGEDRRSIRILRTGRHHAGENLGRVLDRRPKDRPPPLQMCDALERNAPREHPTELCHCTVHARRQFVEIRAHFPEECRQVVESLGQVYRVDAECRQQKLGPQERLRRHQARSGPVMERLRQELQKAVDRRTIEPNSALGGAVAYVLDRWATLTMFLKVPGAPLDNNQAERLLKNAILHRKNSLHYKTQRGADVGDAFMTLIETCRANGVNPFDYLLAVVRNEAAVRASPGTWMPWNYDQPRPSELTPTPAPP